MPAHRSVNGRTVNGRTATAKARLGRKLAALAGATGAVAAGTAEAVPYTPTAGVAAAQGIPGFSFVTSTNVTLGELRPPASLGSTLWDIDGVGGAEFKLENGSFFGSTPGAALGPNLPANSLLGSVGEGLRLLNLAAGATVSSFYNFGGSRQAVITIDSNLASVIDFIKGQPGQFGFRFSIGEFQHYGWGSLVIDGSTAGQGFKITEAYYQTAAGTPISVGQVPQAVPEPSSMALLAIGAAGVTAWRARRKKAQ